MAHHQTCLIKHQQPTTWPRKMGWPNAPTNCLSITILPQGLYCSQKWHSPYPPSHRCPPIHKWCQVHESLHPNWTCPCLNFYKPIPFHKYNLMHSSKPSKSTSKTTSYYLVTHTRLDMLPAPPWENIFYSFHKQQFLSLWSWCVI